MSGDVVIRAQGLGKRYVIGHENEGESYTALRDVITRNALSFGRTLRNLTTGKINDSGDEIEEFWALKDVNFDINRGEVVGIIGRNGAGKSTLLKILSRITEPTEGRVEIKGRIASLLEVGTGFHPELTGRENVFLNGAILGMTRAEIRRKFDEILDFSGVEKFIDTPVKRYSSGMQVRLAFAVAAHLEPEILIVDEVLAVGDAEFQKKCLGKMHDVAGHGRTVLFVSHQLGMIARLCTQGILLSRGEVKMLGEIAPVMAGYMDQLRSSQIERTKVAHFDRPYIAGVTTIDQLEQPATNFLFDQMITVRNTIMGTIVDPRTTLSLTLVSKAGEHVCSHIEEIGYLANGTAKSHQIDISFPPSILAPKDFSFRVAIFVPEGEVFDLHEMVCPIKISDNGSMMAKYEQYDYGQFVIPCKSRVFSFAV